MTTRTLAEIEAEATLARKREESFDRLVNQHLYPEAAALERERLDALNGELAAIVEKRTPPAEPDLPKDIAAMDPRAAASAVAKLRADPKFFSRASPEKRAEQEALFARAQHLTRRAADLPKDIASMAPEAARAKAGKLREELWHSYIPTRDARQELEREIEWLDRRTSNES